MTRLSDEQAWLSTGALMVLAAIGVALALIYTRPIVVPFILALFIYSLVAPLMDWLVARWRFPHWLGVVSALLVVVGPVVLMGLLVMTATTSLVNRAALYQDSLAQMASDVFQMLEKYHVDLDQSKTVMQAIRELPLLSVATSTVGGVLDTAGTGALLLIFLAFMLAGRNPTRSRPTIYAEVDQKVRKYLATKFTISAATGVLVWLILNFFGLELALLFGVLAFLFNFIPSVGSIVATLLPLPIAVAQFGGQWWTILAVVALPGGLQIFIGNVIEPRLMGRGLDLHPVTVILVLAFWGLLWGVIGMVLAVPIAAVLRIVLARFETTRAIADLMAGELPDIHGGEKSEGKDGP